MISLFHASFLFFLTSVSCCHSFLHSSFLPLLHLLFHYFPFKFHISFCLLFSLFLYHLLPFLFYIYFFSLILSYFLASFLRFMLLFSFFSFILNYKVVSIFCYSLHCYSLLSYFNPFSSHTLFSAFLLLFLPLFLLFHALYTLYLRSFLPFFCYSMLTFLYPPSQFHLGVSVFVYTGESFCSRIEMPCNYEARGKYHLSGDAISSWLIVIALSLTIRGTANELAPTSILREILSYASTIHRIRRYAKSLKARLAAESKSTFSKLLHES